MRFHIIPPHPRIRSGAGSNPLPLGERGYSDAASLGRGTSRQLLLEGRHYFLGEESHAALYGFFWEQATGVEFGGEACQA